MANAAPSSCVCNRDITLDELCNVYPKQKRAVCEQYLPFINTTCRDHKITTCLRKAHFLAQVGGETGNLGSMAEGLPRGKTEAGMYGGYKGRGLMQLTGKRNYKAYGTAVHHSFLNKHKTDIEKPKWAADSAGWYWTSGTGEDLNNLADKNDLLEITARINGGFNGFEDRRKHLETALTALHVRQCKTANIGTSSYLAFKDSEVYNKRIFAFAWGYWNDSKSAKKGVVKDAGERKQGYQRYLELLQKMEKSGKKESNAFGHTADEMKSLAEEGSK